MRKSKRKIKAITFVFCKMCRGRFCEKSQKCDTSPNLPRSLKMFICEELSPKFQKYNEQKANGALTREKSKCHN